jgi:hypothetical protein
MAHHIADDEAHAAVGEDERVVPVTTHRGVRRHGDRSAHELQARHLGQLREQTGLHRVGEGRGVVVVVALLLQLTEQEEACCRLGSESAEARRRSDVEPFGGAGVHVERAQHHTVVGLHG